MGIEIVKPGLTIADIEDENSLSSYGIEPHDTLRISKRGGDCEEAADVPKYEMSHEDYLRRPDNVIAWKARMNAGRAPGADPKYPDPQPGTGHFNIGDRVMVYLSKKNAAYPATVAHSGADLAFFGAKNDWVGVVFDAPVGKHDGTVEGVSYFRCPPLFGSFIRRKFCCSLDAPS